MKKIILDLIKVERNFFSDNIGLLSVKNEKGEELFQFLLTSSDSAEEKNKEMNDLLKKLGFLEEDKDYIILKKFSYLA